MSFMSLLRRLFGKPGPCADRRLQAARLAGGRVRLASFTDPSVTYVLTPGEASCTCPDWQKRRAGISSENPGRVCKHLACWYAANPCDVPPFLSDFKTMISWSVKSPILRGFPCGEACRHGIIGKVPYVLGVERAKFPWVNVFVGTSRHGFNLEERRWAYGKKPPNAAELERVAHEAAASLPRADRQKEGLTGI